MSFILNIDTAVQSASVCLALDDQPMGTITNPSQRDQAAWIQLAIQQLLKEKNISLQELDAIAVSAGPGSYTGLRVGMATAKGLCYGLQIPLITISTLQMMAAAALNESAEWLCPMIDARRMEVFTTIYDKKLTEVLPVTNMILDETSFAEQLQNHHICFFGNGSVKFRLLAAHPNAIFSEVEASAQNMCGLSFQCFREKKFANSAYSVPFYGKDFYSTVKQSL